MTTVEIIVIKNGAVDRATIAEGQQFTVTDGKIVVVTPETSFPEAIAAFERHFRPMVELASTSPSFIQQGDILSAHGIAIKDSRFRRLTIADVFSTAETWRLAKLCKHIIDMMKEQSAVKIRRLGCSNPTVTRTDGTEFQVCLDTMFLGGCSSSNCRKRLESDLQKAGWKCTDVTSHTWERDTTTV